MPIYTLTDLRNDIIAPGGWADLIEAGQGQAKAALGFYAQLLQSHSAVPHMNMPIAPDRLLDYPSDRPDQWCRWMTYVSSILEQTPLWRMSAEVVCGGPFADNPGVHYWEATFRTIDDADVEWWLMVSKWNGDDKIAGQWYQPGVA